MPPQDIVMYGENNSIWSSICTLKQLKRVGKFAELSLLPKTMPRMYVSKINLFYAAVSLLCINNPSTLVNNIFPDSFCCCP